MTSGNPRVTAISLTGNDEGITLELPADFVARFELRVGDTLNFKETDDGLQLTVPDPEFQQQLAVARRLMRQRRAILRALADGPLPDGSKDRQPD